MRIIHASDLHFSKGRQNDFKQFYLRAFKDDLLEWNKERKIDVIVITGDLIDQGGKSFKEEDYYGTIENEFLTPLKTSLSLTNENILFIPGNHDVNIKPESDDSPEADLERTVELGLQRKFNSIETINAFVISNRDKLVHGLERIKNYKDFEKKFHENTPSKYISNFESCYIVEHNNMKIGIAAFNSAWRCSPALPNGGLLLGTAQILNANKYFEENKTSFNIALLHHPIEFYSQIETQEINSFFQTLNFGLLLSGHTHSTESYHKIGPIGNIFVSVARTAFSNPRENFDAYKPGYSIIDINFLEDDNIDLSINFRKYIHKRLAFDNDVDASKGGLYKQTIKSKSISSDDIKRFHFLTDRTCRAKMDGINSTLVTHGTGSIAPNDINSIFVLPKLTEKKAGVDAVTGNEKIYTIDRIIQEGNIIIIGGKESGKTTLLNKIFIETSNFYLKYQKIAVSIVYGDLDGKEIKSLVKEFLNEPDSAEIESLLINGQVLILIDNYYDADDETQLHIKNKINKFRSNYPLCKFIITTSKNYDSLLVEENPLIGDNRTDIAGSQAKFKPVFIGDVGVKEFKELTIKWFQNKDNEWFQNNLEKLIKVFKILKIPRTFFSISLYLWIIEKDTNFKPINKANLVYQFLTLILEGLKLENSTAGSYNFDKKLELLTELSLKMHEQNNFKTNYSIKENQATECFNTNFHLNQLRLSPSAKLNDFIKKGILIKDENDNVSFRYEAFYQFFLSYNIDKNAEFKEYLFKEENFLSYIDELDYYTGRRRDDLETLNLVIERLKNSYKEIDNFIKDNVDAHLPHESVIFNGTDESKILPEAKKKKLTDEEIEKQLGKQLENLPVSNSISAKTQFDYKEQFHKVLELSARVLKNSENIKQPDLINEYLNLIINKSAKYDVYIVSILAHVFKLIKEALPKLESQLTADEKSELEGIGRSELGAVEKYITIAPIVNESRLLGWIGSDFLDIPLERKLNQFLSEKKGISSQYEIFLTMFLYSDLKLHKYLDYVDRVIDNIINIYIAELFFIKIYFGYLYLPQSSSLISRYESQMSKLLVIIKNTNKKHANEIIKNNLRKTKEDFGKHKKA